MLLFIQSDLNIIAEFRAVSPVEGEPEGEYEGETEGEDESLAVRAINGQWACVVRSPE